MRAVDLAVTAIAAPLAAPVVLVAGALVRLETDGPALFRQTRVGRDGRHFTLYKLRTMAVTAPNRATHEVSASAVTRVGAFLRRTKLDELPQLLNVARGEMSLVGPRPCLPSQMELIRLRAARGVLAVRPGITGLAQVRGVDMSDPSKLAQIDEQYVRERSLCGDLGLLLQTFVGRGQGDRVSKT